ncbi:hypothetical protein AEP_00555 [Curvibacter sp. AEP1-3]|uniref:DUF551 domain-containing protein n=1 Tax=Curvibacter sp. AEP1-3 TaxID=1844971 RepID=UPI000B3BF48E|nr:DUF551 domain-containing protein [Curvibacter sp. AEP1-3]ARV17515.1 hypothetical protein AEP_00555 [Curvibacter sp. AEP1-3]
MTTKDVLALALEALEKIAFADMFDFQRRDLARKTITALKQAQEPVAFISPKQLELIKDPDGEFGHYIPMRKTSAGNFVMALYAAPKQAEPIWQPIESAPSLQIVLIHYKNSNDRGRTIKARFVPRYTEESHQENDEGVTEYDEANDRYTLIQGWWEQIDNWDDFSEVYVSNNPTHWMPLPKPPEAQ